MTLLNSDPLYLAIDQGTHASRAVVLDRHGAVLASGVRELGLARPQADWAEQDGDEMVASVFAAADLALSSLGERRREIVATGLASQRASCICWDRASGRPLSPLFLNGIAGLGGPFWKPDFESRLVGAGEPWQKAAAVVESIAFLLQANIDEMAKYLAPPARIRVSGGLSRIDGLCRRLVAISGLAVHRCDDAEATSRAIGYLAAGRSEAWNRGAPEQVFRPEGNAQLRTRYRR